ncbi:hypothetical protein [Paraburkholderia tropica]|uniref:hypothetical protein n=1 Tax=Paraburkholderia tropica TaxID=92647 RepID=UPI002AB1786D|nr:hypothetical protein [Paraburkholderia tropica]
MTTNTHTEHARARLTAARDALEQITLAAGKTGDAQRAHVEAAAHALENRHDTTHAPTRRLLEQLAPLAYVETVTHSPTCWETHEHAINPDILTVVTREVSRVFNEAHAAWAELSQGY